MLLKHAKISASKQEENISHVTNQGREREREGKKERFAFLVITKLGMFVWLTLDGCIDSGKSGISTIFEIRNPLLLILIVT